MKKKALPLSKVYELLEPVPIVMVTTQQKNKPNIMTMTWLMMVEFEPPLIACIMSNRNHSFKALTATKECVINIPSVDLIDTVVEVGNSTGAKIDKFAEYGLTQVASAKVAPPMIDECYANIECKVVDTKMAKKYNLFILEAVKAWVTTSKKRQRQMHYAGNGTFIIDGKIMRRASKK